MNRHERRAVAAEARRRARPARISRHPRSSNGSMILGVNSSIPDDIKADIARVVRAFHWQGSGQDCQSRATIGHLTLQHLGFDPTFVVGGMLFRAGHDPVRDVCAFIGPGNRGAMLDGEFHGHIWLELEHEIVDFTCGDWGTVRAKDAEVLGVTPLGEVDWVCQPPEFVWATKNGFKWKADGWPELGELWYCPWAGEPPAIWNREAVDEFAEIIDPMLCVQLETASLYERCEALKITLPTPLAMSA